MSESYFWVVIHDEANYDAAQSIAEMLKGEGKVVWVADDKSKVIPALYFAASFICVGIENHWSERLVHQCNPTADLKLTPEGYLDYQTSQFVYINPDGVEETFSLNGHGIIGKGRKLRPRLKVVVIAGGDAGCTAAAAKAYIEKQQAGVYATPDATTYSLVSTPQPQPL